MSGEHVLGARHRPVLHRQRRTRRRVRLQRHRLVEVGDEEVATETISQHGPRAADGGSGHGAPVGPDKSVHPHDNSVHPRAALTSVGCGLLDPESSMSTRTRKAGRETATATST